MKRFFFFFIGAMLFVAIGYTFIQSYLNQKPLEPKAFAEFSADLIIDGGISENSIPAIQKPVFESTVVADAHLSDEGLGIALSFGGQERFYPFQILVWHEIVNDTILGTPLLIFYGPLTGTVVVYDRSMNGSSATFEESGKLYNNTSLLIDTETQSLWHPLLGKSVQGELSGQTLTAIPFKVVSWNEWKREHGGGEVLSRRTGVIRDYTTGPYGDYADSSEIWFPLSVYDDRLKPKTVVYGIIENGKAIAYQERDVKETELKFPGSYVYSYWFSWVATYPDTEIWNQDQQ